MKLRGKIYSLSLALLVIIILLVFFIRPENGPPNMVFMTFLFLAEILGSMLLVEVLILFRIKRIEGSLSFEKETYTYSIRDHKNDEISKIASFIEDVSERLASTKKDLADTAQHLRLSLDDAPVMIQRFDKTGKVLYINDAYAKHFDVTDREAFIREANIFKFIKEKGYEMDLESDLKFLSSRNPTSEMTYKRKNDPGYLLWVNRAIFDKYQKIQEYQTVGIDITKMKDAQNKLEVLANNISDIVIWADRDLNLLYASDDFSKIHRTFGIVQNVNLKEILASIQLKDGDLYTRVLISIRDSEPRKIDEIVSILNSQYRISIRPSEAGVMILFDDVTVDVENQIKLQKNEFMRDFSFDVINRLTSNELKDIKKVIREITVEIGEKLKADAVFVAVFDRQKIRHIAEWSKGDACRVCLSKPLGFGDEPKWWELKFEEYEDQMILINKPTACTDRLATDFMDFHRIQKAISVPISFNHTTIGAIVAVSGNADEWCELDAYTVKTTGRLIGMALRPAVTKVKDGVRFDKKII